MATDLQNEPEVMCRKGHDAGNHRVAGEKREHVRRRRSGERERDEEKLKDEVQRGAQPHDRRLADERRGEKPSEETIGENVEK